MLSNRTNGKTEFLKLAKDSVIHAFKLTFSIKLLYHKNDLA